MRRLTLGLIVWLNLLSALGSLAWARTWTDTTGRFKVEAELVEVKDGNAVLKKADGPVIAVALQKLSPADREYVNHWAALKKEHPWLDTDAPFDVVTFLVPVPEAENAASLYLHRSDLFDAQKIQKEYGIRGPVVFPLGNLALVASLTDAKWRLAREKYGNGLPGDTSAANIRPDQAEKSAGMKDVPIDPYCDRPLRLATGPAAPVIYSVGADGQDDGARTVWDGAPGHPGDFVFRLEPPRR